MKKIEITKQNVDAAYKVADENSKKVLDALFGEKRPAPTLDDYTTIQSYEDACEALGEPQEVFMDGIPPHIVALMKLETVSRALWGRNFQPKPDAGGEEIYWWAWHALYTQSEIDNMDSDKRGALLAVVAHDGAVAGFGGLYTFNRSSYSFAYIGFRLCQETEEKARYFGRKFIRLWAEYLAFNFTVEI